MGHLSCPPPRAPNTQGQLHVIALLNDPWEEEIKS